jgi:hypothetical protein
MKLNITIVILIITMVSCKSKQTKFINDVKIDSVSNVVEIKKLDSIGIKTDSLVENIEEEIEYQIVSDSIGKFYSLPIKIKRKITKERKLKSIDLKHLDTTKQQSIELKKQVQQIDEKVDNTSKFKWLFIVLGSIILIIILIALYV